MGHGVGFGVVDHQLLVAVAQRVLHAAVEALGVLVAHLQAVHHYLHRVVLVAVEAHAGRYLHELAVHAGVDESLLAQLLEQLLVVALAVAHHRRQDVNPTAGVLIEYQSHDALAGVAHHLLAAQIAARMACAGVEQAQEVVYLGGGADGASRVAVNGLLLDGYHGAEAGDEVDIGPLERAEHVAGVGRERLDVAALSLGEYRVEGQRRLARAAQPGDYRQRVARDGDVDVLEVVHARAFHPQAVGVGRVCGFRAHSRTQLVLNTGFFCLARLREAGVATFTV